MTGEAVQFTTTEGTPVLVSREELVGRLQNEGFTLFGMDVLAVLEFRKCCQARRIPMPFTAEKIRQEFGP